MSCKAEKTPWESVRTSSCHRLSLRTAWIIRRSLRSLRTCGGREGGEGEQGGAAAESEERKKEERKNTHSDNADKLV